MLTNIFSSTEENKQKWMKSVYILISTICLLGLRKYVYLNKYATFDIDFVTQGLVHYNPLYSVLLYMIILTTIRLIIN